MITIPAVLENCAGIDVGKRGLAVAVMKGPADKEASIQTRWVGTTVPELEALREWLLREGVSSVAMESTASYWIPVKNILEKSVQVMLVCAKKHHPKKGKKTDFRDAIELAHLHRHGLLTGSYMPEQGIIELRDLTRRRKKLLGNLGSEKNRIQKVLEVANVKIGNVISDVFGVSGQEIIRALLSGVDVEPEQIAELVKKNGLKAKIPQLTEALEGHLMNEHHRWLIQQSIDHAVLLDRQLEELEDRIRGKVELYRRAFDLIGTIPGIKDMLAAAILAEVGADMSVFPSSDHLCSWAAICPGNNQSAGKTKSGKRRKGNKFLSCALIQAAMAATRIKDCIMHRKYQRWVKRLGPMKAYVAVAHSLMRVIWCVLTTGNPYREPDSSVIHELEREKLVRHHARRLRALGAEPEAVEVIVDQLLNPAPIPETQAFDLSLEESRPPEEAQVAAAKPRTTTCTQRRSPEQICRGKLGIRPRQPRNRFGIVKDHSRQRSQPKYGDVPGSNTGEGSSGRPKKAPTNSA